MTPAGLRADLRREHLRLRYALVRVEIIGIAFSKGIFTPDIAAELAGISLWPQSLVEAAVEWRAERDRREPLPDIPGAGDFLTRVMADDPPRRKYRRAA